MINRKRFVWACLLWCMLLPASWAQRDSSFFSRSFGEERWYRIYLPRDYEKDTSKRYPVIYYFHGYGGRYKWDSYDIEWDPFYPEDGRKDYPFVMEWRNYVRTHDVIIVTWDGYEPHLHPGRLFRDGIPYGQCAPYDYPRAHDTVIVQWGWDYRMYFRDLVAHIDSNYRTLADRDHRAVTGLSMGGLTSLYIGGQDKDLISSVSAFCPADNYPMYGPKGHLSVFPVLEMYRSLEGLPVRLTATDGDWLFCNDKWMKRIFYGSGFPAFAYHQAVFPDHAVADADRQLDFHLREFGKKHPVPRHWSHICPSFDSITVWGYDFRLERSEAALFLVEDVTRDRMTVMSRRFIPGGPLITGETVHVMTAPLYEPHAAYDLVTFNLTGGTFEERTINASSSGRLAFDLRGGGHVAGISRSDGKGRGILKILLPEHRHYLYFESGKHYHLPLTLVNVGTADVKQLTLRAFSSHPAVTFGKDRAGDLRVGKESLRRVEAFDLSFGPWDIEHAVGNILLEVSVDGVVQDTQKIVFFMTPPSPVVPPEDVLVLDGRSVKDMPVYVQGYDEIRRVTLAGGKGNGNGIPEAGEEVLVWIRLPQGPVPGDTNTWHRTFLIGDEGDPYVSVERLKYDIKIRQAGATSVSSYIKLSREMPGDHHPAMWFRVESLWNYTDNPAATRPTYEYHYDYRRVFFR